MCLDIKNIEVLESVENAKNLPTFLQQSTYIIGGAVCTPLTFIATKEKNHIDLTPFSFVIQSKPTKICKR